jgi:tetratricopeptide (TPR) repeat protein
MIIECCLCNEVKNESIPESDDRQCLQQQQQQQQQKWKIPIDQLYDEAQQCEYSKDFVRARRLYTEIVQRAEVSEITIEALNRLGILAQQEGDLDASQSFFQQALQLNPNSGFVYNNLANIFVQRGDIDSAISCYRAALAQQKDNVEIYLNLASFLLRTEGRRQEAIEVLREAVSIFPTNSQLHSYLAGALQEEDQLDAAITHHKLALNYASEPSVLLIMKVAMALIERKDYDAARVYVQQALQLPVVNNEPHKAMALLLKNEGKSQESIEFLYRAIEIDPHDASSYYQLAVGRTLSFSSMSLLHENDTSLIHYHPNTRICSAP